MNTKQVIVLRTRYPDNHGGTAGLRLGKSAAQVSHAAMAWLTLRMQPASWKRCYFLKLSPSIMCNSQSSINLSLTLSPQTFSIVMMSGYKFWSTVLGRFDDI